jgi:hypothetical protein
MHNILAVQVADGTTTPAGTSEVVLGSRTFPIGALQAGKVIKFEALTRTTDSNSTDTLTVRVRLGPTTLTGTAILETAAVDQADNDVCRIEGTLVVRDVDGASVIECFGTYNDPDAVGTAVKVWSSKITALDLDPQVAVLLEITGQWSASHADNDVAIVALNVSESAV